MLHRLLLDAGTGDQGNGAFLATLPEDIRNDPSLGKFKDVGSLGKSYIESQKLIGSARVVIPGEKATAEEWGAFYNKIGRPETADKYELPDVKLEEGLTIDENLKKETLAKFHSMGLTKAQTRGVMEMYLGSMNNQVKTGRDSTAAAAASAETALKEAWGDKFTANVDIAKAAIKKFGGEESTQLVEFLNKSGLGNNVPLIKVFHKIGMMVQEDSHRGGGGGDLNITDQTRALQEIETLKMDQNFQKALGDARSPGHGAALQRWMLLHKAAHPGTEKE